MPALLPTFFITWVAAITPAFIASPRSFFSVYHARNVAAYVSPAPVFSVYSPGMVPIFLALVLSEA